MHACFSCPDYSILLLVETTEILQLSRPDYPALGKACRIIFLRLFANVLFILSVFGKKGEAAAHAPVVLQQLGACVAYVCILGSFTGYDISCPYINRLLLLQT